MGKTKPQPGSLVEVVWIDHARSSSDTDAQCPVFRTPGYFRCFKKFHGHECLICDRNKRIEPTSDEFEVGWDTYPMGAVLEIVVL
jgi:hypothetical protein